LDFKKIGEQEIATFQQNCSRHLQISNRGDYGHSQFQFCT